jgi:hypothetical protein
MMRATPPAQQLQEVEFLPVRHHQPPCCCVFEFSCSIQNSKNKSLKVVFLTINVAITSQIGSKISWNHPALVITDPKVKLEDGEDLFLCCEFVSLICEQPCRDRVSGHKWKRLCQCLSILIGSEAKQRAVAAYMVAFIQKPIQERHTIIIEWLRYTATIGGRKKNDDGFFNSFHRF